MKVLLIGKNGQLGWELTRRLPDKGFALEAVDLPEFDITHQPAVDQLVKKSAPDIIINACAYTAVDQAESDSETAFAVNHKGPMYLAEACAEHIPLVHISTDYVFDGSHTRPYVEDDTISPLGVYGRSKALGEQAVAEALDKYLIVRTAWLCGVHGQNFVKTMLRLGKEKKSLNIVDDQVGCPTFAFDLAEAVATMVEHYARRQPMGWGIYHYCGKGKATWYQFGCKVFDIARQLTPLEIETVNPVPSEAYPTPARRPANSVLSCEKIEENFGIKTIPWPVSLEKMLKVLFVKNGSGQPKHA
jgi:dTDP-4-dehydrorhamnose reductase